MVILAFFFLTFVFVAILFGLYWQFKGYLRRLNNLKERCLQYNKANNDTKPGYGILAINDGWAVVRISHANKIPVITILKYFDDGNSDEAYEEAEKLLNVINV